MTTPGNMQHGGCVMALLGATGVFYSWHYPLTVICGVLAITGTAIFLFGMLLEPH